MTPVTSNTPQNQLIAYIENDYASESQWMRIIDDCTLQLEKKDNQSRNQPRQSGSRGTDREDYHSNRNKRRP